MNIAVTGINFIRQAEVAGRLKQLLSADAVLYAEEDTRSYECDGLSAYRQLPMVVALPSNEEEVQQVLRTCHELKVPVVARGAGTGLSGGALPMGDGVLLSLAKMRRILALDPVARTARVQPGVTNLAISDAAAPCGLFYAPDPSSQIACSIGGNVAENSGGVHCLKYGLTLHNVLRVRAVTIEGEVVEFGSAALDSPGLDTLALMIGSEGMLAVATEITVKLLPKPEAARVILASFDDVEKAGNAVADVVAAGVVPSGLEMMDRPAARAVEEFAHAGYDLEAAALLLCEADGTPEEVEEVCFGRPLVQRGKAEGKSPVYYVLGQSRLGRYLFCVIIRFPDGNGYPDRLAGEEIPLGARIIHVADALDSMLTTRIYRAARPAAEALAELRRAAGTQFCPRCVGALERILPLESLAAPEPLERMATPAPVVSVAS